MEEYSQLQKKQNLTFILVCINFALFMLLFVGLGYVTYQSVTLVNRLKTDLDRAEQTVADLQDRFHNMDTDVIVERLVATASESLERTIKDVVQGSELTEPLHRASERMAATHEVIEETGEAIQGIHETVKGLDNELIAQRVSYHILKGLGDGFHQAAESRKPQGTVLHTTQ